MMVDGGVLGVSSCATSDKLWQPPTRCLVGKPYLYNTFILYLPTGDIPNDL